MSLYYFLEPFNWTFNLSVAMLSINLVIISIIFPFLRSWSKNITLQKLRLEKNKIKLSVNKIVEKYNSLESEKDNLNLLLYSIIFSIAVFFLVIVLSYYSIMSGSYVCLNITTCVNMTQPVWALDTQTKVLGLLTTGVIIEYMSYFVLLGFLATTFSIYNIIKIVNKLIKAEVGRYYDRRT